MYKNVFGVDAEEIDPVEELGRGVPVNQAESAKADGEQNHTLENLENGNEHEAAGVFLGFGWVARHSIYCTWIGRDW
jgi:hypothetical protein